MQSNMLAKLNKASKVAMYFAPSFSFASSEKAITFFLDIAMAMSILLCFISTIMRGLSFIITVVLITTSIFIRHHVS